MSFPVFLSSILSLTDPNEEALELATPTDPVVELLKQGAGKQEELRMNLDLQLACGGRFSHCSVTLPIQLPSSHQKASVNILLTG